MSQSPFGDQQFNPYDSPNSMSYKPPGTGGGTNALAIVSLVLGIISLVAWLIACCGVVVAIPALITGFIALQKPYGRGMAIGGLVTAGIGLVLSIINWIVGIIIVMNNPNMF